MVIKKHASHNSYIYEDDASLCYCSMYEGMSFIIARLAATLQAMEYHPDMKSLTIEVTLNK